MRRHRSSSSSPCSRPSPHPRPSARPRRGAALLAALGLLLLGAALLAGTAMASAQLTRATRSIVAIARADAESRRALVAVVQGWDVQADSLPVGARMERIIPPLRSDGPRVAVSAHVQRLSRTLYAAFVTVRVGEGAATIAMRRMQLLLERLPIADSARGSARPAPLAQWSVADRR